MNGQGCLTVFTLHRNIRRLSRRQAIVSYRLACNITFLFSILPGQIFNKTTGQGFNGKPRSTLEWVQLAQKAGFKTVELLYQCKELQMDALPDRSLQSLLYFNNKCYGTGTTVDSQAASCCMLLGQLSGENIRNIFFKRRNYHPFAAAKSGPIS